MRKKQRLMEPVHPGEILQKDFLKPLSISINKLALELHVPATRMGEIVHGRRRVTADTALRLARYFKTKPEFWLNLQNFYDLEVSRRSEGGAKIDGQVQPVRGAAAPHSK
jgi:addiction module HigA family antidote